MIYCIHDDHVVPLVITDILLVAVNAYNYVTRSKCYLQVYYLLSTEYTKSISHYISSNWNNLPVDVKNSVT